jgi:GNAT superfamily N-acetyltransferase
MNEQPPTLNMPAVRISVPCATTDDVERLLPLFDAYRRFYRQAHGIALARGSLAERLARSGFHVLLAADEAGRALGFVQLYPMFSSISCRRTLALNDLCVMSGSRGLGIGRALLQQARHLATHSGQAT